MVLNLNDDSDNDDDSDDLARPRLLPCHNGNDVMMTMAMMVTMQ